MKTKKTKKTKIFAKIFSIFMICCFAFLAGGCMGELPDDLKEDLGDDMDDIMQELVVDMYGTKILYRPDSYDLATNAGSTDYYNKFSTEALKQIKTAYSPSTDFSKYTDYVKALEYVVYCYALGIAPETISVRTNAEVNSTSANYYIITAGSTAISTALNNVKTLFNNYATFVGISEKQLEDIGKWIVTNLLGNRHSDTITATLKTACSKVKIGENTLDKSFMASEIKEYAGDSFFIFDDGNFANESSGSDSRKIIPLEYQSVTIMLKSSMTIDEIWVALKYDADLDGTEEGVWDSSKYIDMIVEVNYFSHAKQKSFVLGSKQTRVYDGPYDMMGKYPEDFPSDHGLLMFGDFDQNCDDQELKDMLDNGSINVGKFNTEIGNGATKTDVGTSNYNGLPVVSKAPLIIDKTKDARNYYSVVQPKDGEVDQSQTYQTGKLNPEMFKGSDGCDYIEITYKVLKDKNNLSKNYKFYTGLAAVFEPIKFD